MATTSCNSSIIGQLNSPPRASLQILGTHITNEQAKVIDFDIRINCLKVVGIKSAQFLTSREQDYRSWDYSANQTSENPEAILDSWLNDWLANGTDGRCWTLCKLVSFPDDDCAVMKAHIERLARNTAYGGSIEVVFHTPYPEPDNAVSEKTYNAQIRVKWKFECPFPPTDQVWNDLVMNAMVDRKKGWIARDVPTPSHGHGMSPFRRAIKGTSQIISQEQDVDGSKRLVQRFSPWGCDGSS